jgi:hypothetical protein
MIDPNAKVLTLLEANAPLVVLCGNRIYAGRDVPPPGYKPADGSAITFRIRGGPGFDEEDALLTPSFQFKCYGASEIAAQTCYRALVDALHNGYTVDVLRGIQESVGQLLEEPGTEWPFVLVFFTVWIRTA